MNPLKKTIIPKPSFFLSIERAIIFLALININMGYLVYFDQPATRVIAWLLGWWLTASFLEGGVIWVGLAFLSTSLLLFGKEAGFLGVFMALVCLQKAHPDDESRQGQISLFLMTTSFLAIFDYLYYSNPYLWYAIKKSNLVLMKLYEIISRQNMAFGHHPSGLLILISFLFLLLSFFFYNLLTKTRLSLRSFFLSFSHLLPILAFLLLIQLLYLFLHQILFSRVHFTLYQIQFELTPFGTHWLLFLFASLALLFLRTSHRSISTQNSAMALLVICLILYGCGWNGYQSRCIFSSSSKVISKTILLFDNLDFSSPVFGYYGDKSGGMFGNLPYFLETLGYKVKIEKEISPSTLAEVDCLVVINLAEKFNRKTKAAIHSFVTKGGSLLVMGDHTGIESIREPFNDLLKPLHLAFRFDSAFALISSWQNCLEIRPHSITKRVKNENDLQIWTGASLTLDYPAKPIIIGQRAFSDQGDPNNMENGYLGDCLYQKSEWLGDLVLVAEEKFGQGKVVVFGDTSSLQNSALPYSYEFACDLFRYLTNPAHLSQAGPDLQPDQLYPAFFQVNSLYPVVPNYLKLNGRERQMAFIDASHGELFELAGWKKNSIDGLLYNLMRNKYLPFLNKKRDFPWCDQADLAVFINPTKAFSQPEKDELRNFLNKGGLILWSSHWPVREAGLSFLTEYGLDFLNIPLGPVCGPYQGYQLQFQDAWPIVLTRISPKDNIWGGFNHEDGYAQGSGFGGQVSRFKTNPKPLYEQNDDHPRIIYQKGKYPLVVFQPYGQGGILLISDGRFLLNHNLEHIDSLEEGNILFLRDIIKTITNTLVSR